MADEPERRGSLSFSVDARHVRQLGRELVQNRVTAVSELIKNSYDADATRVEVSFSAEARERPGGALVVSDNGTGMTLDDIRSRWMVISTDYKDTATLSERYGRRRAGQKGIGRFAAETLGDRLVLSSTVRGSSERVLVEFNWEASYTAGTPLDSVTNPFRTESASLDEEGTTLTISDLHGRWDEETLMRVREAVFLLQPPFRVAGVEATSAHAAVDPGFQVVIRHADTDPPSAPIGDVREVLSAATASLEGHVNEYGKAVRRIRSDHLGIDLEQELDQRLLLTGAFSFNAAYFVFSRDALNPEASVDVGRAKALAKSFGGIRLYRDELRILPYGEPYDDWLGLEAIYRQRGVVLAPIGRQNFFGEVLISREKNPDLIDTASREGVVESQGFEELRAFLRDALVWTVNEVAAARQKKPSASARRTPPASRRKLLEPLVAGAKRVAAATSSTERDDALNALLRDAQDVRDEARRSDKQEGVERKELLNEIALLRVLASLGGSIAVFSHEVKAIIGHALAAVGDLATVVSDGTRASASEHLEQAEESLASLAKLASHLDLYLSHGSRRRREPQPLFEIVTTFANSLENLLERRGVDLKIEIEPIHLRTSAMSRSEIEAILFNFLSNSLKALDDERIPDRRIKIECGTDSGRALLRFLDTGSGVPPSVRDRIFEAFVTTTDATEVELGVGTGLGLKIVADIAEANGGEARLGTADPPFTTCFEVRLPMWEPSGDTENAEGPTE